MTKHTKDIFECRAEPRNSDDLLELAKSLLADTSEANITALVGAIAGNCAPHVWESLKPLGWVNKAISDDETRPHIMKAHVDENGDLVATDGHRLHILKSYIPKHGHIHSSYVDRKGNAIDYEAEFDFVPYAQVVPGGECTDSISLSDFVPHDISVVGDEVWALPLPDGSKWYGKAQYICDAFGNDHTMDTLDRANLQPLGPLKLVSRGTGSKRIAVVMPQRG